MTATRGNPTSSVATPSSRAPHVHRIQIDTPNGPTCEGRCACGYTRTYSSSGDDTATYGNGTISTAHRLAAGDAMRKKKGGAKSAAQSNAFYGSIAESSIGKWI